MTVLVLAPHTDDDAFGMGATIAKLVEQGHAVHIAAFSVCMQSVLKHLPPDTLITEFHAACQVLGVPRERRHIRDFRVRTFDRHRQEILDWMIELREELRPHRVYMPSLADTHQDHEVVAKEALRAFKSTTQLNYELPWNCPHFHAQYFEAIDARHINTKLDAIRCYQSQRQRPYAHKLFTDGLAIVRGVQAGVQWAEAFEVVRMLSPLPTGEGTGVGCNSSDAHDTDVASMTTNDTPGPYTPLPTNIER